MSLSIIVIYTFLSTAIQILLDENYVLSTIVGLEPSQSYRQSNTNPVSIALWIIINKLTASGTNSERVILITFKSHKSQSCSNFVRIKKTSFHLLIHQAALLKHSIHCRVLGSQGQHSSFAKAWIQVFPLAYCSLFVVQLQYVNCASCLPTY